MVLKKSFVTAIAAICKLLLYPNCWIVITAQTVDQANKIVEDKIQNELINKISKYLLYLYEKEWLLITKPTDGYMIRNTLNNSVLRVVSPVESSRGIRSNFTIYDEVAIMKKESIDNIFDGMLFPRQPNYIINNPEYANNPRWLEESKAIYLTSSKFKWQWWYKTWRDCVTGYYNDKKTKYNIFASDFFDNIDNGLKTWGDYRRAKRTITEMALRMEYLNEAIGENEDAFYSLKSFNANQVLQKAFIPPKPLDIYIDRDLGNPQKEENEVRFVVADYAFANTTSAEKNDNSVIMCMSLHWKKYKFERHVDYIELWPGSDSLGAGQRVRELYWLYDADYVIHDGRSGGESIFNSMTAYKEVPELRNKYNPHGLTVSNNLKYQIVQEGKYKDLVERTVDPQAVPCIIPIIATTGFNSNAWVELKKQLESDNIKFLVGMSTKQEELEDTGEYFEMTSEQFADKIAPYGQTDLLIQEAVNLKAEFKMDKVKLIEPRSGTKDRIVVLSYGNYIASLIENEWNKQLQATNDDWEDADFFW